MVGTGGWRGGEVARVGPKDSLGGSERGNTRVCVIETGGICWAVSMTGLCDNTKGNDGKFSG